MRFFRTLAEGGQTWAHRVRMVKQVLKIAISFSFLISVIYAGYLFSNVNLLYLQSGYYHVKGMIVSLVADEMQVSKNFWQKVTQEKISSPYKKSPNRPCSQTDCFPCISSSKSREDHYLKNS